LEIREHQQVAVDRAYGLPGFGNFDGMGKGKTATTLFEIAKYRSERGPTRTLVVCPKTARSVWERHSRIILPDTPIYQRTWWVGDDPGQDVVVITNYEQLTKTLNNVWWDFVVADEVHYMQNRKADRSIAVKQLTRVKHKRGLSGTPMLSRPDNLWSILNWLYPKEFRGYWKYFHYFVESEHHVPSKFGCPVCGNFHQREWREIIGPKNVEELKALLRRFCIRRTTPETNIDHEIVKLEMHPLQRKAYDEMAKTMLARLEHEYGPDGWIPAPVVIAQRTRMRQFASAYMQEDGDKFRMSEPSNKLDAMMDDVTGTDMPLVVFSNFTQLLNLAAKRLDKTKIPYRMYTGQNPNVRDQGVDDFQSGKAQVMLANIRAGGIAITLSTGRHALFLSEEYSPSDNNQAWGRLFNREDNPHGGVVKHYRSEDSEDNHIAQVNAVKVSWFRQILGS
jgi:SNF2 family DNA or RNA helicase